MLEDLGLVGKYIVIKGVRGVQGKKLQLTLRIIFPTIGLRT